MVKNKESEMKLIKALRFNLANNKTELIYGYRTNFNRFAEILPCKINEEQKKTEDLLGP